MAVITTVSMPDGSDAALLTLSEAAAILRVPVNTMRWWRQQGTGPTFFKIGRNLVTTVGDLRRWIEEQQQGCDAAHPRVSRETISRSGYPGKQEITMASIHMRSIRWETKDGEERSGRRYQARYRDRSGQEHARLFKLKRDAQNWLNEQTAGIVTGQWADPRAGKQTLKTYAEQWRARQVHADTTELQVESILRNHIFPAIGRMRLDSISPADVQALVKSWSVTAAPSTVENRYLILAIVLRAAVRDRVIPASPCVDIKLPRITPKSALVPITTETVLALWEAMADRYNRSRKICGQ